MAKQAANPGSNAKRGAQSAKGKARGERPEHSAPGLDRVVHERLRLGMLSALAVNAALSFNDLKGLLNTTDGNLSVHGRKLEEAGYVSCEKSFHKRMPKTEYRITSAGRKALEQYLEEMEQLIKAARRH